LKEAPETRSACQLRGFRLCGHPLWAASIGTGRLRAGKQPTHPRNSETHRPHGKTPEHHSQESNRYAETAEAHKTANPFGEITEANQTANPSGNIPQRLRADACGLQPDPMGLLDCVGCTPQTPRECKHSPDSLNGCQGTPLPVITKE
jgi:hypothetical protein